jgi:hypothetical protein
MDIDLNERDVELKPPRLVRVGADGAGAPRTPLPRKLIYVSDLYENSTSIKDITDQPEKGDMRDGKKQ